MSDHGLERRRKAAVRRAERESSSPEERAARRREITGYIILIVVLAGFVFFGAWGNSARQHDLLSLACGNAQGHRDLTIQVAANTRVLNDISRELGLPIEPVTIHIPKVPSECVDI